jgi:hypothetical protein
MPRTGFRASTISTSPSRRIFPGVRLSNRLREKYPQEMTIVLQHQFWDLDVTEHTFEVGLSFSGIRSGCSFLRCAHGFFDPPSVRPQVRQSGMRRRKRCRCTPAPAAIRGTPIPSNLKQPRKSCLRLRKKGVAKAQVLRERSSDRSGAAAPRPTAMPQGSAEVVSLDASARRTRLFQPSQSSAARPCGTRWARHRQAAAA